MGGEDREVVARDHVVRLEVPEDDGADAYRHEEQRDRARRPMRRRCSARPARVPPASGRRVAGDAVRHELAADRDALRRFTARCRREATGADGRVRSAAVCSRSNRRPMPDRLRDEDLGSRAGIGLGRGRDARRGGHRGRDLDEDHAAAACAPPSADELLVQVLGCGTRVQRDRGIEQRVRAEGRAIALPPRKDDRVSWLPWSASTRRVADPVASRATPLVGVVVRWTKSASSFWSSPGRNRRALIYAPGRSGARPMCAAYRARC